LPFYGEPVRDFDHAVALAGSCAAMSMAIAPDRRCHCHAAALAGDATRAAIGYAWVVRRFSKRLAPARILRSSPVFTASFRPGAPPPETPIAPRILVCHGDADPLVPREQVLGFWQEMDAAQANWHFHAYSGVKHGFTDPGSDARGVPAIAYDASADRQSWAALTGLLDEVLA
jgi:acetyl esterase/lipase